MSRLLLPVAFSLLLLACSSSPPGLPGVGGSGGTGGGISATPGAPAPVAVQKIDVSFEIDQIAFDPSGNAYVGCRWPKKTSLAKITPAGKVAWTASTNAVLSLAADASGVVVGVAAGVVKYDPSGAQIWSSAAQDPTVAVLSGGRSVVGDQSVYVLQADGIFGKQVSLPAWPAALSTDSAGNVYAACLDVPPSSVNGSSLYLVKLDSSLATVFSKKYPLKLMERKATIAIDAQGRPVVSGFPDGPFDLGSGMIGDLDSLSVLAFDADGGVRWADAFLPFGFDTSIPFGAAVSSSAEVFVVGNASHSIDFGGGPIGPDGTPHAAVGALDSSGNVKWARDLEVGVGGPIALDPDGNVVVAVGKPVCPADFGAGSVSCSSSDHFLVRYPPK